MLSKLAVIGAPWSALGPHATRFRVGRSTPIEQEKLYGRYLALSVLEC